MMKKSITFTPQLRWMFSAVVALLATDFIAYELHWFLRVFIFIICYNMGVRLIGELPPDREFYDK